MTTSPWLLAAFAIMQDKREGQERPCLHCMMVELIENFLADRPSIATKGSDKVDTAEADQVIDAIAKTMAELTSDQDGTIRQQLIEQLMQGIIRYDGEFRNEAAVNARGSDTRH
jgi:hypothetical protein